MKKNFKLGVIGAGFMASAIINGIIKSKVLKPSEIICSDISDEALKKLSEKNVYTTSDNSFLVSQSEYVLFAVKPQSLDSVFNSIKNETLGKIITIVAGTKKAKFKKFFNDSSVARCMPNTPCSINSGAIGIDLSDYKLENDRIFIKNILSPLGDIVEVDESELNAVTGISGSSPAYFYLFIKALIDSAKKYGISEEKAKKLAVATMIGSGKMIQKHPEKSIDELIFAVCSKGGTTIEAMNIFEKENFTDIIKDAVDACVKRAKDLENL